MSLLGSRSTAIAVKGEKEFDEPIPSAVFFERFYFASSFYLLRISRKR